MHTELARTLGLDIWLFVRRLVFAVTWLTLHTEGEAVIILVFLLFSLFPWTFRLIPPALLRDAAMYSYAVVVGCWLCSLCK